MSEETKERIKSFADVPDGWHYGEGVGATEAAIERALEVVVLFEDFDARVIEALPMVNGGIQVCGFKWHHEVEVDCDPSGNFEDGSILYDDGDFNYERKAVTVEDIRRILEEELKWNLSYSRQTSHFVLY